MRSTVPWAGVAALALAASWYAFSYPLNHDVGWYLYIARAALEGEGLYTSLIEVNPPLASYLAVISLWLSSVLSQPVDVVAKLFVVGTTLLVVAWATILLRDAVPARSFVPLFAALLLVGLLAAPGIDLGQREHLMTVFAMPYIVVLWRRLVAAAAGRWPCVIAGMLAGLGFALKPHFVLVWLVLEAWYYIRLGSIRWRGSLRPEALVVVGLYGVYASIVILFHREYLGLLWDARDLYTRFNAQPRQGLIANAYLVPLLAGAFLLWRRTAAAGELGRLFLVFATAAFATMVLQGKGWSYHLYPALAATVVVSGIIVWDLIRPHRQPLRPTPLGLVAVVLLIVSTVVVSSGTVRAHVAERDERLSMLADGEQFFAGVPKNTAIVMLTDRLEDSFPLVTRTDLRWASPFPSLWWIRALYGNGTGDVRAHYLEEMDELEAGYFRALVTRIRRMRPEYIAVDTVAEGHYGERAFPYVSYLRQDPGFSEDWEAYARVGTLDGFVVWQRRQMDPVTIKPGASPQRTGM